jgi:hypothetical protein
LSALWARGEELMLKKQFLKEQSGQTKKQDKTEKSLSDMQYTGVLHDTL